MSCVWTTSSRFELESVTVTVPLLLTRSTMPVCPYGPLVLTKISPGRAWFPGETRPAPFVVPHRSAQAAAVGVGGHQGDAVAEELHRGEGADQREDGVAGVRVAEQVVHLQQGATGNTIGGTTAGAANLIAFNGGNGVTVGVGASDASTGDAILEDAIFANALLGIDLERPVAVG